MASFSECGSLAGTAALVTVCGTARRCLAPAQVLYHDGSGLPAEAACYRLGRPPAWGAWD